MKNKKILIIIIVLVVLVLATIFGIKIYNKKLDKKRINELENAAEQYYILHMSNIIGLTDPIVTLALLNDAPEEYEISSLKKCDKEKTRVLFEVENSIIKKTKLEISCK